MQLKTILNRVERHKSFVYGAVHFGEDDRSVLEVAVHERANGRPICSGCGQAGPGYDRLPARRYEFVPLWALPVFLLYAPRRVDCRRCGVKVERLPWADGKSQLTRTYQWFLASWSKLLPWQQVANAFHTSWQTVYRSVEMAVSWGLSHRNLEGIKAIGVDEVQWRKGHRYLTLVYQIDGRCRRLLHIAPERTVRSLLSFFRMLGKTRSAALRFVCSDMWQPYLKTLAQIEAQLGPAPQPFTGIYGTNIHNDAFARLANGVQAAFTDAPAFAGGFVAGLVGGAFAFAQGVVQLVAGLPGTVSRILQGITSLVQGILSSNGELVHFGARILIPDLYNLVQQWPTASASQKGYLAGKVVGVYGMAAITGSLLSQLLQGLGTAGPSLGLVGGGIYTGPIAVAPSLPGVVGGAIGAGGSAMSRPNGPGNGSPGAGGQPNPGNIKRIPNNMLDEESAAAIKEGISGNPDLYYDPKTGQIYYPRPGGGFTDSGLNINDY